MKKILVPVDFSDVTSDLIEVARRFANTFGSHVVLLNVLPPPHPIIPEAAQKEPHLKEIIKDYNLLNALDISLQEAGITATIEQPEGHPVEVILEECKHHKADMIIMGSHGHGALYNLLVGSVTEGVLKSAKCPVLVVPSKRE